MNTDKLDITLVHHDLGASKPGASKGPSLIWNELQKTKLANQFVINIEQKRSYGTTSEFANAKHIDAISQTIFELSESIKANIQRNSHCLVIAGDHSTAAGTIAGLKKAHPDKRIGVVWFDAHADIHSPHTSPSGNMHGMPLAIATDQDNTIHRTKEISQQEHDAWEELQAVSVITPATLPRDIVFVGIRDLETPEVKLISAQGSLNLYAKDLQNMNAIDCVDTIEKHLLDCDYLYVSFDLDCLDASEVPGTGTPVDNGPKTKTIIETCKMLLQNPKTICFEIAEYNPDLDDHKKTLHKAVDILTEVLSLR